MNRYNPNRELNKKYWEKLKTGIEINKMYTDKLFTYNTYDLFANYELLEKTKSNKSFLVADDE
jgi:hypothetical protein